MFSDNNKSNMSSDIKVEDLSNLGKLMDQGALSDLVDSVDAGLADAIGGAKAKAKAKATTANTSDVKLNGLAEVTNIVKTAHPVPKDTIELCRKLGVLKYLPSTVPNSLSFDMVNCNTALANAFRRVMQSELSVMIMVFDSLYTSDNYIIQHQLSKAIGLIPIRQISGLTFYIDKTNNTTEIIQVNSAHIRPHQTDNADRSREVLFSKSFVLCDLRPGKTLKIDRIYLKKGVSYIDGAAHTFPGKIKYESLDDSKSSSMNTDPTSYRLGIPPQKYVDPAHMVRMAADTLIDKLTRVMDVITTDDKRAVKIQTFYSDTMEIIHADDRTSYKLMNETYTIGALLKQYCCGIDSSITNIHYNAPRHSAGPIIVNITHSEPNKIMLLAIESALKDINNVKRAF
jgi:DNA-directed RNA polymerase subunit L